MFDPVTTNEHRRELAALRTESLRRSARRRSPGRVRRTAGTALIRFGSLLASDDQGSPRAVEPAAYPKAPACAGASS
jgi:hypothetical protein